MVVCQRKAGDMLDMYAIASALFYLQLIVYISFTSPKIYSRAWSMAPESKIIQNEIFGSELDLIKGISK